MSREKEFQLTPQREVIIEELGKLDNHPTADEVYEAVRKRMPKISLGTVYRNLEILSEQGMISKIELATHQKRFDMKKEEHYHIRCTVCGKIEDASITPDKTIEETVKITSKYEITGHTIQFLGKCPDCKGN